MNNDENLKHITTDVKTRYLVGGVWKVKEFKRKGKASRTYSKPARTYLAVPPTEGWPGGVPEKNGYKAGGR
jgi:hypothetical protein